MNDFDTLVTQARQDDRIAADKAFSTAKEYGEKTIALEMFMAKEGPIDVMTFESNDVVKRSLFGSADDAGASSSPVFLSVEELIEHLKLLIDNQSLILYEASDGQLLDIPSRVGMLANKAAPVAPPSEVRQMPEGDRMMAPESGQPPATSKIKELAAPVFALGTALGLGYLGVKWWRSRRK